MKERQEKLILVRIDCIGKQESNYVPILNLNTYIDQNVRFTTELQAIQYWAKDTEFYDYLIKDFISYYEPLRTGLEFFKSIQRYNQQINSQYYKLTIFYPQEDSNQYENYRTSSLQFQDSESNDSISICYSIEDDELNAILSIIRTIFLSIVLSVVRLDFNSKSKKCQKQQKKQQRIHITNVTLSYQCYSKNLRQIDRVIVKGSIEPMNIYTVDLNVDSLIRKVHKKKTVVDFSKNQKQNQTNLTESEQSKQKKNQKVLKRDKLKQAVLKSQVAISETQIKDNNIKQSRVLFNKEFYHKWEKGFSCYLSGDWDQAQLIFKETLNFLPNYKDFLSKILLRVIKEEQYLRNNWKGYNELREKLLQTDFFFLLQEQFLS